MLHFRQPPLVTLKPLSLADWLAGLCLVIAYLDYMLLVQHPVAVNLGEGWDGYYYYRMALHTGLEDIYYPLWLRYGLPELAGVFPTHDVFLNFKLVNLACALAYGILSWVLLVACTTNMHRMVAVVGWLLVCANNLSPLPYVLWYPVQTDSICSLFALVFLWMVIAGRLNPLFVALLFFAGTTVRENFPEFLVYIILRLRLDYDHTRPALANIMSTARLNSVVLLATVAALLASALGLYSISVMTGHSPFEDKATFMLDILTEYFQHPVHLLAVATNAISAVLFVYLAARWSGFSSSGNTYISSMTVYTIIVIIISIIAVAGGTNPERYWYWSMPLFVIGILPALDYLTRQKNLLLLVTCLAWAAFIQRAFVAIDTAGIGKDCSPIAILLGSSNWTGHWADQCDPASHTQLALLAGIVLILIYILAKVGRLQAQAVRT